MAGKPNALEDDVLKHLYQNADIANIGDAAGLQNSAAAGNISVALHTAYPGEGGDQTTSEVSYTGYARVTKARNATEWPVSSGQVSNGNKITFGEKTGGSDVTALFWSTGGESDRIIHFGHLGTTLGPFVVEAADLAADHVTLPAHGLSVDDRVVFYAVPGFSLPSGITEGTVYYVGTVPGADNITLSTTAGNGAPVDITAIGYGIAGKVTPRLISNGVKPEFDVGQLTIDED